MIPDTAAALLALLGLVAPGLVFELRRERRRPQAVETTFREASRVALTSLLFTLASLGVLLPLSAIWSALPDVAHWLRNADEYVPDHYAAVAWFLGLEVTLAIALALAVEAMSAGNLRGNIVTGSVWYSVLRRDVPPAAKRTWLWITTQNGTQFKGPLRSYTAGDGMDDREIALGGAPLRRLPPGTDPITGWEELDKFDAVVISSADIRHFAVTYLDVHGETLRAEPPMSWWQRVRAHGAN